MNDKPALNYPLREAAELLRVSEKTLRREYQAGRIIFRYHSGKYFVDHEELLRWRNEQPQPAPGERAAS